MASIAVRAALVGSLLAGAVVGTAARAAAPGALQRVAGFATTRAADPGPRYAGWAMDAYPGDSVATLRGEMGRQLEAGANVIWLGHNNPGEVDVTKGEPALSYAVWAAYQDGADPKHVAAAAIVLAQRNALDAARSLGARVVLPVGYQIQMGTAWNLAHCADLRNHIKRVDPRATDCADLRRNPDLSIYGHGGYSATFYAPSYQRDILAYYRWVERTFVRPYAGTILMLNIADEPIAGDYGPWADRAFRATHPYGLLEAGNDPQRQEEVGRFQSEYVADYAAWSATQWAQIDPAVKVTLSFCGGYGRYGHEGPNIESVFSKTPANFVVTFDAYPRDGLYNTPLTTGDLTALFTLVRSLGYYSTLYNHPLWLWSTGNSWGLNGASRDPGTIADAVANGIYLAQLVNGVGGDLQGIAVWNYNIKGQGLYNDTHQLAYSPDELFARISASFPLLRRIMASPPGRPNTVVLAPNARALRQAGAGLLPRPLDSYAWTDLAALARNDLAAVTLTHLADERPAALRTAIVLARALPDLRADDLSALRALLDADGTVLAAGPIAAALASGNQAHALAGGGTPAPAVRRLASRRGLLLAVGGAPVERLFADENAGWAEGVLALILGRAPQQNGYITSGGGTTLLYSATSPRGVALNVGIPPDADRFLTIYSPSGLARERMQFREGSPPARVVLDRRSYALLDAGA